MSRGPDAATLLGRALRASAEAAGCPVLLAEADWSRWASATFTGARHHIVLAAPCSTRLDEWLARLRDADLPLRRHLVADLAIAGVRRTGGMARASLEILTVEEN